MTKSEAYRRHLREYETRAARAEQAMAMKESAAPPKPPRQRDRGLDR